MSPYCVSLDADLTKEPLFNLNQYEPHKTCQISVGDLHGNTMKLLYILIQNKIIELKTGRYTELKAIYDTSTDQLTSAQLDKFHSILAHAKYNHCGLLRLLGDELADRGRNDYFTLLVLKELKKHQIPVHITLSNHSVVALMQFDHEETRKTCCIGTVDSGMSFQASSHNMWTLLSKPGFEQYRANALNIVQKVYKPSLKLIDYCATEVHNQPYVSLFTHAPIGLETIQEIAADFELPYDDSSIDTLKSSIDQINQRASEAIINGSFTTDYFNPDPNHNFLNLTSIGRLFWARTLQSNFTLKPKGDFTVGLAHGHIGAWTQIDVKEFERLNPHGTQADLNQQNQQLRTMLNLDNDLGKGVNSDVGTYLVLVQEESKPLLLKQAIETLLKALVIPGNRLVEPFKENVNKAIFDAKSTDTLNAIKTHLETLQQSMDLLWELSNKNKIGENDAHMKKFVEITEEELLRARWTSDLNKIQRDIENLHFEYHTHKDEWGTLLEILQGKDKSYDSATEIKLQKIIRLIQELPLESRNLIWTSTETKHETIDTIKSAINELIHPEPSAEQSSRSKDRVSELKRILQESQLEQESQDKPRI